MFLLSSSFDGINSSDSSILSLSKHTYSLLPLDCCNVIAQYTLYAFMQVTGAQRAAIAFLRDDVNCCWAAVLALLAKYSFGLAAGVSDACTREAAQVHYYTDTTYTLYTCKRC
jgi:hypothetical protein